MSLICEAVKPFGGTMTCHIQAQVINLQQKNALLQAALNEGEPLLLQAADRIVFLETQVIQIQTENERLKENQSCGQCEDDEQNRWCERLEWLHTEYGADSSGCDSGDPLDCVEVEIRQAINAARKQAAKECIEMISIAIWSKSGTAATAREAIKAVFEIVESEI
jgi:hypothetical protein